MIAIITYERYPDGSPGAIRCKSFAESYIKLGFDVIVIHTGTFTQESNPKVVSCYDPNRYKKYFCFERNAIGILEDLKKQHFLQAVLTYSFFSSINSWCRRNNIVNVVDVVEWYSKEQFKRWYLSYSYLNQQFKIRNITRRNPNVIAISSYLEKYFREHGCKTVRIPIITNEFASEQCEVPDMNTINLIYAGTHVLMDNVLLVLKSIVRLSEEARKRIKFSIYGLKRNILMESFTSLEQSIIDKCVVFYGRRPNSEVLAAYRKAHFTIFLRNPELRVNKAGFPSKVIESLKMGVPVLSNFSSDLKMYLKSGYNSIIVDDLSEDCICEVIHKLLALSPLDYATLRKNAIKTVKDKFNTESFSNAFSEILY